MVRKKKNINYRCKTSSDKKLSSQEIMVFVRRDSHNINFRNDSILMDCRAAMKIPTPVNIMIVLAAMSANPRNMATSP